MKTFTYCFLLATFLLLGSFSSATRPKPDSSKGKYPSNSGTRGGGNGNDGEGIGQFFGPGTGFGVPGFGNGIIGGGYGGGFGGPNGGYGKGGIIRPTVVCKERGPCYNKKLTCPAKCFTSYSRSGKGYGGGGGGGGCTMDCKNKCIAYC